jgi:hypothetical protein
LAESNADGERKIKAGAFHRTDAVEIQGADRGVFEIVLRGGERFPLRVGKRAKMVVIS